MEQKLLTSGNLLDDNGNLVESGYATTLIKEYSRNLIKAKASRIKEWDYYFIGNDEYGIALTIADNSYMSLFSATLFFFKENRYIEDMSVHLFTNGKTKLPQTSKYGNLAVKDKKVDFHFDVNKEKRHIYGNFKKFGKKYNLSFDINLLETTSNNSMVIATPFKKKRHFYYNQKINNFAAKGSIFLNDKEIKLDNSFGVLDWGRGVWTRRNTWYWSSLSSKDKNGNIVGFNLGYGFGVNKNATENMLFVNDKYYKLDDVEFVIRKHKGKDMFLDRWEFKSSKNDICLIFTPVLLRKGGANLLVINSKQRQVFGYFDGYILINDGKEKINIDHLFGFAEKVYNRW